MIFFGSRGRTVSGNLIEGIQCPSCESKQFVSFGILRYFHLYWIPTILTSKAVGIECTHCKKTLIDKEIPKELSGKIAATVFNRKNTLPMFTGLFLIAILTVFGIFSAYQDDVQEAAYIEQPAVNDIYIVDLTKIFDNMDKKYRYGAMRIKQISSGQVEFQVSTIAYNKASGVRKDISAGKASADSYYDSEPLFVDLEKLKDIKSAGAINSIERR